MTKFCKDCQYLSNIGMCHSPKHPINPVTGQPTGYVAALLRKHEQSVLYQDAQLCGPDAKNFKQKEAEGVIPWWKFWSIK
jgi:hypothetical protein